MRRITRTLAAILALAAGGSYAQSQTKIYGFADGQFDWMFFNNGMIKRYVGKDTISLKLTHANVYFDFKPNDRVSALVEIGFLNRPSYEVPTDTREVSFTYKGAAISNEQAKAIIVQAQMARIPSSYPQAVRDSIQGVIEAAADQKIADLNSQSKSVTGSDKLGLNIERAYVDLNIVDPFRLRFGKFITPAGVWNVDHGSPVVLTVRQPFQTTITPIFPESQTGVMGFGSMPMGDHDLLYSGYVSGGRIDGAETRVSGTQNGAALDKFTDLAYGGHIGVKLDLLRSVALGASYYNGSCRKKYDVTEVTKAVEEAATDRLADVQVNDVYTQKEREYAVGGDAKIEVSKLLVQGEVNFRHRENELADGSSELIGWYGLVAWSQPINDALTLTPYGMYESLGSSVDGEGASGSFNYAGLDGFSAIVFGLNATIFSNLHIKTEYTSLRYTYDDKYWVIDGVDEGDMDVSAWSTQVSVAF